VSEGLSYAAVSRRFVVPGGERRALVGLDLECAPGRVTSLLGPNGAGKSTALALAAGLLDASGGSLRFDGIAIDPTSVPRGLGYLPQRSRFPPLLRVGEILRFTARVARANAARLEAAVELGDLDGKLDLPFGSLSGGWARRLGLAVALVAGTRLVLLDEPFVGLDLVTLERVQETLRQRVAEGAVVVVASHELEALDDLAPVTAVLDQGRLLTVSDTGASSRSVYRTALARAAGGEEARERVG